MKIDARELVIELGISLMIGVVLATVGPFGSYEASFAQRLAYWVPLIFVGYAIMRPAISLAGPVARRLELPQSVVTLAMLAIANAPLSLVIAWFNGYWPRLPSFEVFFLHYVNVGVISAIVFVTYLLVERRGAAAECEADVELAANADRVTPFHARLPHGFELVAVENEDHYVRAHARDGRSELILMRLRDAIAELEGADGTQVHRGWWVAREAVTGDRRDGRRVLLKIGDELEAPVARDRVSHLRSEGWF